MTDLREIFALPGMQLLDAFGEAVFGFDADGRCLHASLPALNLLHVASLDEIVGRPLAEVLKRPWPASLPAWEQCLAWLADNPGKTLRSELETVVRPDGQDLPVAIALVSVPVPGGAPVLAAVVRDLSERSRQSKAFHASVKSFRALLDSVSDAIFFLSRQGKVIDANQGIQSMFGYSPALFLGKSIDNILDLGSHELGLISSAAPSVVDGQSRHIEFTARNRRGETFPAEIYLYPSSYFNQSVAMAIVHDISERRRQEAALTEARDLAEQSSRLKGEIIRNMSHEFRTPLAAMIGMGDLLGDTELDEEQKIYLDEALSSAKGMLELVNGILDLAKLESGHYRSNTVDFNLAEVFNDQARRFAEAARSKGLALRVELDPVLPAVVGGDMEGIGKALALLVDNAVKFTDRGEVVLAAGKIEAGDCPPAGCSVRFAVRDTGIGIPEEARARLFDAFVQGDGSATRRHGGIGLGLGIASRLVVAMGGRLEVDSAPGRGSEFRFDLKLSPPEFPESE
ncbi:MAG: PAS domain S-box protein [Thiobacillus sp.]|nr:PAS domain S-box protein [Thiobacillus sp.]